MSELHKHGLLRSDAIDDDGAREAYGAHVDDSAAELSGLLDAHQKRLETIHRDHRLSDVGRKESIDSANGDVHQRIDALAVARRKPLEQLLKNQMADQPNFVQYGRLPIAGELKPVTGLDPTVQDNLLRELRQRLMSMPPIERIAAVRAAAQQGDIVLLAAAQGMHPLLRVISADEMKQVVATWLDRLQTPAARRINSTLATFDLNVANAHTAADRQSTPQTGYGPAGRSSKPQQITA